MLPLKVVVRPPALRLYPPAWAPSELGGAAGEDEAEAAAAERSSRKRRTPDAEWRHDQRSGASASEQREVDLHHVQVGSFPSPYLRSASFPP